jgi:hypothetical protein
MRQSVNAPVKPGRDERKTVSPNRQGFQVMTTGIPGSTARRNSTQQVGYVRFTVNYNDNNIGSGVGKQWLPAGALIVGTDVYVGTAFNAATTNVLTVGIENPTYADIVSAAAVNEGATGLTTGILPTGAALGPLATDAQVFVMYAQTGTAATAGQAIVVIKYIPNNDL